MSKTIVAVLRGSKSDLPVLEKPLAADRQINAGAVLAGRRRIAGEPLLR